MQPLQHQARLTRRRRGALTVVACEACRRKKIKVSNQYAKSEPPISLTHSPPGVQR